ncbi:radical SAM protein [Anaerosporomusa subterranea]|uniref:Radical SAM protein n=1 Tax=Anaerosporomusa subterranea TaxID=1794912 RepID=A0A154BML7_ANASB|nr:B12-binding domain-containing radical SAM protein [Anaerosporomusa subterranea]KYZ75090.1 radical SAM protein [Anaerosporomusa subterranea]
MRVLLTTLNAKYVHTSLALRNLQAYCHKDGIDTSIKEYTINQGLSQILSDIYRQDPEVIGIACYIWNINMVIDLCSLIKKVMPETVVILGGPEVSYDPAEVLQNNPFIDYVVMGEGEESLSELLRALMRSEGKGIAAVSGTACYDQGQITVHGQSRTIAVLDDLPFAYQVDELKEIKDRIIYYETSRGCPFSCQYCLSSATVGVRFYSLQRIFADLQTFIDQDVRQVKFVDRTFNTRKEHYLPIIRFLSQQNCRTNFHFEIAADLLDEEAIALLSAAPSGRFQLEIGVQSTHEPTLEAICRHNDWDKIQKNVSALRQNDNMHLHLDLIVGLPYETLEFFSRSFNDVYSLQPHMLQIGFLKMLKGSGVRHSDQLHDYVYTDSAPYEVLANRYLSYGEVRELQFLEEVFNLTYNSSRFHTALNWLIKIAFGGNAFSLYHALSSCWEQKEMNLLSHSPKAMYEFLIQFCRELFPTHLNTFFELLKFDALTSDGGTIRPEVLPWNYPAMEQDLGAFWRNEAWVGNYLPNYRFTSWREVKRSYQVELFTINIPEYLRTGQIEQQNTTLLFNYHRDGLWTLLPNLVPYQP